jgi:protein associated with RNAse G/E
MSPGQSRPREPVTGRAVRILSTKFDGSLHNDFAGQLIDDGDALKDTSAPLRVFVPEGTPIQSYRGAQVVQIPFTALFWPGQDCWWNVYHNHRTLQRGDQRWSPEIYANVSSPATFDGETVRWVDLDLDVTIRAGVVELLDEDEFAEHRVRMAYSDDIVTSALEAASTLLELAARRAPPFDRETHLWAPAP